MKKPLKVGLILMGIGGISAGLIALTNFLTENTIKQNEIKKKQQACSEIYKDASFSEEKAISDKQYLISYTEANKDSNLLGYIYYTKGKNAYGEISMMVGINFDSSINRNLVLITNTQSYAQTLVKNYVDPFKSGDIEIGDVKCGATYGAKLIKSMVEAAQADFNERSE